MYMYYPRAYIHTDKHVINVHTFLGMRLTPVIRHRVMFTWKARHIFLIMKWCLAGNPRRDTYVKQHMLSTQAINIKYLTFKTTITKSCLSH